jgi:hypothetical protein
MGVTLQVTRQICPGTFPISLLSARLSERTNGSAALLYYGTVNGPLLIRRTARISYFCEIVCGACRSATRAVITLSAPFDSEPYCCAL